MALIFRNLTKYSALLLALLMLGLTLGSCGSTPKSEPPSPSPEQEESAPKDPAKEEENAEVADEALGMRVMSFNILCNEFTSERINMVIHMIQTYQPDIIGFQDATVAWMTTLAERLGDDYGYVGCGRNADLTGEATPVFYQKSRFTLVESETLWLSDTPDVAGSKFESSSLPRIMTCATLEEVGTGKRFVHVNTHLDHTSEEARKAQIGVLLSQLVDLDKKQMPYVLTGDFNCTATSNEYRRLTTYGLANSANLAKVTERGNTYHGYGTTGSVIDFIFLNKETATVDYYRACDEVFVTVDGSVTYPSDHNPIIADLSIKEKA